MYIYIYISISSHYSWGWLDKYLMYLPYQLGYPYAQISSIHVQEIPIHKCMYRGVPEMGIPQQLDGLCRENQFIKWMIWGYPMSGNAQMGLSLKGKPLNPVVYHHCPYCLMASGWYTPLSSHLWRFPKMGVPSIAGWFVRENPIQKWMIARGTPNLGNPHMASIIV